MSVELVKKNALTVIEEASNINTKYSFENLSKSLLEMQNTVKNFKINAPLIGLFSAGKSSILNKYFDKEKLLPTGIEAKTSVACEFVYDTDEYLEIVSDKNESSRKSIAELKDLTIENCSFVRMHLNSDKLMNLKDITIVDMPGLDSGYEQHNKAIKNYISSASYFIIIMDIENGTIKKSLLDFLKELDLYKLKFGFILSKYEQKEESDIEDIIKNTEETILNHIGEKVFVGKVSPHNSDIADFENILSNMQTVDIAKNNLYSSLKLILEDLLKELNRKLKYDRFDINEINKNIRELEKKSQDIEKSIEKEAYFIKNKANNQLTDAILSDISNTLSENVDMLVMKAKENSSSLGNAINQLVRKNITVSSERNLRKLFSEIYERLHIDFTSTFGELKIDSVNVGNIKKGDEEIDIALNEITKLAARYLPTLGLGGAGSLAAAAAALEAITFASVAVPIAAALVVAFAPLFAKMAKGAKEEMQNENIRSQILGNIIPKVISQIRDELESCIFKQTDAFIKAVREKFETEQNNIKEALENAKKEKEVSEKEFNEKQEILKADIEKTEKLILEIKE